ncbi:hypothetical protein BRADI_3g03090v3 [Brachypodium distachyon]|uniref:CASP-like protein n=1 Tax=Brachypodium distachyon TaxID=15368 RepID=A0A2K2CUW7_BRADI|nr:hypothetical protein BRADI_3g03090v3 [Brachypodium distachyon]
MVPEVSPSRSPPRAAGGVLEDNPPPLPPPMQQQQQRAGGEVADEEASPPQPPQSASVVVSSSASASAAAAKYVPPRGAERAANPAGSDGRLWYSWNGSRAKDRRRAQHQQPPPRQYEQYQQPPPPPRQQPQPVSQPWAPPEPKPKPRPPLPSPSPEMPPPQRDAPPPVPMPGSAARSAERDRRGVTEIMSRKRRTASLQRAALVARAVAAGLCLAALAVLAADSRKGWALDSYSNYTQLRYSEAVNVIGFVYSVFQFFALAAFLSRKRPLIPRPKGDYFDFTMDQSTLRTSYMMDNRRFGYVLICLFHSEIVKCGGTTIESCFRERDKFTFFCQMIMF